MLRHAGVHPDELQHGGREPTATQPSLSSAIKASLEELKNIKITLCNETTVQIAKFPEISPEISTF